MDSRITRRALFFLAGVPVAAAIIPSRQSCLSTKNRLRDQAGHVCEKLSRDIQSYAESVLVAVPVNPKATMDDIAAKAQQMCERSRLKSLGLRWRIVQANDESTWLPMVGIVLGQPVIRHTIKIRFPYELA